MSVSFFERVRNALNAPVFPDEAPEHAQRPAKRPDKRPSGRRESGGVHAEVVDAEWREVPRHEPKVLAIGPSQVHERVRSWEERAPTSAGRISPSRRGAYEKYARALSRIKRSFERRAFRRFMSLPESQKVLRETISLMNTVSEKMRSNDDHVVVESADLGRRVADNVERLGRHLAGIASDSRSPSQFLSWVPVAWRELRAM